MWFSKSSDVSVGSPAAAGRVLRPDARVWFNLGASVAILPLIGAALIATSLPGSCPQAVAMTLAGAACVVGALVILAQLLWSRTVLYPDRIERRDLLGTRVMLRSDIAGYRSVPASRGSSPAADLASRRDGEKPLRVYIYGGAYDFQAWRSDLPDLDLIDIGTLKAQLLSNPDLGATPAERQARLDLLKRVAWGFNGLILAVAVWVWFWPSPYPLAITAAIALIPASLALIWWSKGVLTLAVSAADPRSNVGLALVSGMLVAFKAIQVGTDQWPVALAMGAILGALPVAALYALNLRWGVIKRGFWGAAALMLAWGWGAVMLVDSVADGERPDVFRTTVLNRSISHGRSTTWNVELAPWSDHAQANYQVRPEVYDLLADGGAACVGLHPGALGVGWFEVHPCRAGEGAMTAAKAALPPPPVRVPDSVPPVPVAAPALSPAPQGGGVLQPSSSPYLELPKPDDMATYYPDAAQRRNLTGRTKVTCTVADDGRLGGCVVISEAPAGVGFADATLRVVRLFRLKPVLPDGSSSAGKKFTTGIRWQLPR